MAQVYLDALKEMEENLESVKDNISGSKDGFYNALQAVGVEEAEKGDTFEQYASLIRNLLTAKDDLPFMLEISIPDTTDLTTYKKTVVLPMYFGVDGNSETTLNDIATEIISAEAEESASSKRHTLLDVDDITDDESDTSTTETEDDPLSAYRITDAYGNEIIDGNANIPDETWNELNPITGNDDENGTIAYSARKSRAIGATDDEDTPATADDWIQDSDATYSYYVDWGDGSDLCYYDPARSYTANKTAIWHTYESEGVYDISIYGTYKRVSCLRSLSSYSIYNWTDDGSYVYDNDGEKLYYGDNYGMRNYLIEVISWGKTGFTNLQYGFCYCQALTSVPMYDTTSAFTDVTSCEYTFHKCTSLSSLPFNEKTDKGLFSDCGKITTFAYCFYGCTGYTSEVPVKLCDGCSAVTTISSMFRDCSNLTGSLPEGFFNGMSSLTNASYLFCSCPKLDGEVGYGLFKGCSSLTNISYMFYGCSSLTSVAENVFSDCVNITSIAYTFYNCTGLTSLPDDLFSYCVNITGAERTFYGCSNITGKLKYGIIGTLSKLTETREMFYNCSKLEGFARGYEDDTFDPDTMLHDGDTYDENKSYAFYDITADGINLRQMFYGCTSITEIPEGLIESLTGLNNYLEKMFEGCTGITYISPTALASLHVMNARGMFGLGKSSGNSEMTVNFSDMTENEDWSTYEGMKRWLGVFANAGFPDDSEIPLELGGDGDRRFSDRHVGAIVLKDETLVDPKDYEYDSGNVPIGIVYADVYLDPDKSVATLSSGSGNVVDDGTEGAEHKLFCTVLNDTSLRWTYVSSDVTDYGAEDITTITNTSNVNVGYNRYTWTESDGECTVTREAVRYNGEAYHDAIMEWQVSSGLIDDYSEITSYTDTKYYAANYVYLYQPYTDAEYGLCFLPDGADLWDQFVMRQFIYKACTAIINGGGSYTSSNCYPMRNGTYYWASAESSSSYAWNCATGGAHLSTSPTKWASFYVRPSFALTV